MNATVKIQASAGARHRKILFREYESTLNARIVDSRFLSVSVGSPRLQGERRGGQVRFKQFWWCVEYATAQ